MELRPLGSRVAVKRKEIKTESDGGIAVLNNTTEKQTVGEVVGVGRSVSDDVKVGYTVLFGKYCGNDVDLDGGEVILLNEDDIFGILT